MPKEFFDFDVQRGEVDQIGAILKIDEQINIAVRSVVATDNAAKAPNVGRLVCLRERKHLVPMLRDEPAQGRLWLETLGAGASCRVFRLAGVGWHL